MTALDLKSKRILVTGGSGFLGRQVLKQLCKAGAEPQKITVLRSRSSGLRVLENCQRAVAQQEIVIHLAAHVGGIGLKSRRWILSRGCGTRLIGIGNNWGARIRT